jgi:hypothetical protein
VQDQVSQTENLILTQGITNTTRVYMQITQLKQYMVPVEMFQMCLDKECDYELLMHCVRLSLKQKAVMFQMLTHHVIIDRLLCKPKLGKLRQ